MGGCAGLITAVPGVAGGPVSESKHGDRQRPGAALMWLSVGLTGEGSDVEWGVVLLVACGRLWQLWRKRINSGG